MDARGTADQPINVQARSASEQRQASLTPLASRSTARNPYPKTPSQISRQGKAAITFFVKPEAKAQIRAALADGGFGTSFQQGLVNLLNALMQQQKRERIS